MLCDSHSQYSALKSLFVPVANVFFKHPHPSPPKLGETFMKGFRQFEYEPTPQRPFQDNLLGLLIPRGVKLHSIDHSNLGGRAFNLHLNEPFGC